MARYQMDDGNFVNTNRATERWDETTCFNGQNMISNATLSQWEHETLYLSSKGRYYVEHTSQWQGSVPFARWLHPREAAAWLLMSNYSLPQDLKEFEDSLEE